MKNIQIMNRENRFQALENPKSVGIIGGLGPETSCNFCLHINQKFIPLTNCQPHITLENIPVPKEVQKKIINGKTPKEMLNLILKTVKRLNDTNVDFIVMPCNTAHVFIDSIRKFSEKPVLSIIEECAKECNQRNLKKVLLLGSTTTVKSEMHKIILSKFGIKVIIPTDKDQERVANIIIKILNNTARIKEKNQLIKIIEKAKEKGADGVILGCTDLPLLVKKIDCLLPVIDTCEVLENATVNQLLGELI